MRSSLNPRVKDFTNSGQQQSRIVCPLIRKTPLYFLAIDILHHVELSRLRYKFVSPLCNLYLH